MKFDNQLRYALHIIDAYKGDVPLTAWLKDFYKTNKQMGSRDRKTVSEMVYGYYRLGHNEFKDTEERMLAGINMSTQLKEVADYFRSTKTIAGQAPVVDKIFPWTEELSENVDASKFAGSFLVQPDPFLRVRPGNWEVVTHKLTLSAVPFEECGENCLRIPNNTRIQEVVEVDKEAVIQDKNSQLTSSLLNGEFENEEKIEVWDCCSGSGGKSIMVFDMLKGAELTVSDKRISIIKNLQNRFSLAGIGHYDTLITDLSRQNSPLPEKQFDLIIADVPCTGSGTWARTPEQLYFFKREKIEDYQQLQKKIVSRVIPLLKKNGKLLYITCSVFKKENEEIVAHILANHSVKLLKKELLPGYAEKADTLFAALFINLPV